MFTGNNYPNSIRIYIEKPIFQPIPSPVVAGFQCDKYRYLIHHLSFDSENISRFLCNSLFHRTLTIPPVCRQLSIAKSTLVNIECRVNIESMID